MEHDFNITSNTTDCFALVDGVVPESVIFVHESFAGWI
jgi:hypothetical protein